VIRKSSNIPQARRDILRVADWLEDDGAIFEAGLLRDAVDKYMFRGFTGRQTQDKRRSLNPTLAKEIRDYTKLHPAMSQDEIGRVFRVAGGRVSETLDRDALAAAQTPQGFRYALLARAYEQAFRDRVTLTDEAMALERIGLPVTALPGSARNRKLTTPEDLAWAEGILAGTGAGARV